MSNKVFIVDAFTSEKFKGNQAAVCLISQELSTEIYQKIAAEFNLSETVFPLPLEDKTWKTAKHFSLRWFTPTVEIDLCGHATLATAHVLFNEIGNSNKELIFSTLSGDLVVKNENGKLFMDFPCFKNLTNYSFENLKGVKSAKFVEKVVKVRNKTMKLPGS
uniref:Phenazine biosynthesis-like domain-containing protein n=1 Tax=Panagrolaimus sp. JU765 TaxID=591449 RepID=A0AC34PZ80_9BILA